MEWTKAELKIVDKLKAEGKSIKEIANILSKSYDAVAHKYSISSSKPPTPLKNETIKKQNNKDMSSMVIQSLKEELMNVTSYTVPNKNKENIKGDSLIIHITDLHAGKIVKNPEGETIYNENIFKNRMEEFCLQILKLLDNNISKGVPITDVVIVSTGDLANGEGIYLTQAYEQEIAPPSQVMLVVNVLSKLITSLLDRKLPVRFVGVRGNHGRTGKDTDVASNWDLMIYMILDFWARNIIKNPNLQIKYAETEHMTFDARGHKFLIRHIAPEQVDSPAGRVKINEWARQHKVDGIIYGHYHHAGIFDCDRVRVIRGGSTVGGDSLSENMAKNSEPIQVVFGTNEQRVTTFIYFVDLKEKK